MNDMGQEKLTIRPKYPRGEDGCKTFSIRIKEDLVLQLEQISNETGHSRNELISMCIDYALKHIEIHP